MLFSIFSAVFTILLIFLFVYILLKINPTYKESYNEHEAELNYLNSLIGKEVKLHDGTIHKIIRIKITDEKPFLLSNNRQYSSSEIKQIIYFPSDSIYL